MYSYILRAAKTEEKYDSYLDAESMKDTEEGWIKG